jgi:MFS family permease
MSQAETRAPLIAIAAFAVTMISMAAVGVLIPLMPQLSIQLHVPMTQLSFAIALFSFPSAIAATLIGGVVDRVGARRTLLSALSFGVLGDLVIHFAASYLAFCVGVLLAGAAFAFIVVAAPAYLMTSFQGAERTRAMSLWSTYAPTGFACGLLLAAPFTGTPHASWAILVHAGLLTVGSIASSVIIPEEPRVAQGGRTLSANVRMIRDVLCRGAILRLSAALTIPSVISYGTSMIAPSYLANAYGISLAASSSAVAVAKLCALLIGGMSMGVMLVRNVNAKLLFAILVAAGAVAQFVLFFPASGLLPATAAIIVWLFCYSGVSAICFALLPVLNREASQAAASGVANQIISLGSFAAAPLYFGIHSWRGFVLTAVVGLFLALIILPSAGSATSDPLGVSRG